MMLAQVVVDVRTKMLDRSFDYVVPSHLEAVMAPGFRVLVPFGPRLHQGYVLGVQEDAAEQPETDRQLKAIHSVLDDEPVLSQEFLSLTQWLCRRYACTQLEAIEVIVPSAFRQGKGAKPTQQVVLTAIGDGLAEVAASRERRAPKQAELLRMLATAGQISFPHDHYRPSDPAVKAIVQAGHAVLEEVDAFRGVEAGFREAPVPADRTLTPYQERALRTIDGGLRARSFQSMVVHGVTGSGKTEVYLRAIATCLQVGGQAIVLVPEISLTPQMVGRFTERFGEQVAVLHSRLTAAERKDEWFRLQHGLAKIAIGARSAVFAPLPHPRLIIVDEEHEATYKQEDTVRYDAREVARWRAEYAQGLVLLGSATPSLTTMHAVDTGRAKLVSLPTRVNGLPLPPVEIVDMREELRQGNRTLFSDALQTGVEAATAEGGQVILFLNRRGYASFVLCRNCGDVIQCPHCDITLTLHRHRDVGWLTCHYCQYRIELPSRCPTCDDDGLKPFGVGTQSVEQAVRERWPSLRVLRLDVDTTRQRGSHQAMLQTFYDGEADVLVGTQMVAKGLDFAGVTFVGVVSADTMLAVPDYRSAERTFNLLTQVAGRAGRSDRPGRTVIQTFRPEHYAIIAAARHDYASFYRQESAYRTRFGYPPACELACFVAVHHQESYATGAAARFERELRRAIRDPSVIVLPASPASPVKVEDLFRYQVVIKYSLWDGVREEVVRAYQLVYDKLHRLGGYAVLDVDAGRI